MEEDEEVDPIEEPLSKKPKNETDETQ